MGKWCSFIPFFKYFKKGNLFIFKIPENNRGLIKNYFNINKKAFQFIIKIIKRV